MELTQRIFQVLASAAILGLILGLGIGLFGLLSGFLWSSMPAVKRRRERQSNQFESDLRAFEDAERKSNDYDKSEPQ